MSYERDREIVLTCFRTVLTGVGYEWPFPLGSWGHKIMLDGVPLVIERADRPPQERQHLSRDRRLIYAAFEMICGPRVEPWLHGRGWQRYRPDKILAEVNDLFPPEEPSFALGNVVVLTPEPEPTGVWARILNSSFPATGAIGGGAISLSFVHQFGIVAPVSGVLAGWIIGIIAAWKS